MAINCDPDALAALAKCFKCQSGNLTEIQTYLLCQILNNGGTGGGSGKTFQSALFPVNVTAIANVPHGLGGMPQNFQARMVCVAPDLSSGMQIGDESECACWFDTNDVVNLFNVIATATNMIVTSSQVITAFAGNTVVATRTGGFNQITDGNNFRVKIYASL